MLLWFETIVVLTEQYHSKKLCKIRVANFIGETRKGEGIYMCMCMYDKNAYIGKTKKCPYSQHSKIEVIIEYLQVIFLQFKGFFRLTQM